MKEIFSLNKYTLLLWSICIFHLISNTIWVNLNTAPLPWDQAGHTRLVLQFVRSFETLSFLKIVDFLSISSYYPPLIYLIISVFVLVFDKPIFISSLVVTFFFIGSIIMLFMYTERLTKSKQIALGASFIYSFLPILYEHSRWLLLEIPMLFFILLALFFLDGSQGLTRTSDRTKFFISAGLATLTKWLAPVYLIFPVILQIREYKTPKENIIKGIALFLLVIAPWYLLNTANFIPQFLPNLQGEISDPQSVFSVSNFLFYIYLFINFQLTLIPFVFFLASAIYLLLTKNRLSLLLLGNILFIYLLFSLIPNKDWRYTMPILPFAAITISIFLKELTGKMRIIGSTIFIALGIFLVIQYLLLSFRFPSDIRIQKAINLPIIGWIDYINLNDNLAHSYNQSIWPHIEIVNFVHSNFPSERVWLLTLIDQERMNAGNLLLQRDILGYRNIEIESPPSSFDTKDNLVSYLLKFKYVLVANDTLGNPATRNIKAFEALKNEVELGTYYKKVRSYNLPNGESVTLYERI